MPIELRLLLFTVFFAGFIGDVFFIPPTPDWGSDIRLFILALIWLFVSKFSNFNSITTFKVTLGFLLVLSFLFIFFRTQPSVERVATWVYIYLAIGVVQQLFESRKETS